MYLTDKRVPSKWRSKKHVGLVCVFAAGLLTPFLWRQKESSYEGKRVSQWFEEAVSVRGIQKLADDPDRNIQRFAKAALARIRAVQK